jgi:hypothetical protein
MTAHQPVAGLLSGGKPGVVLARVASQAGAAWLREEPLESTGTSGWTASSRRFRMTP